MASIEEGIKKIEWARAHMHVLREISAELKEGQALKGLRISMALHLEAKTAVLAIALKEAGADIRITSCNPLSTDDDVALAALEHYGVQNYAKRGQNDEEYYIALKNVLDLKPNIIVDDGCDLINLVHTERKELLPDIIGANEETTTGVVRLQAMEKEGVLQFPVMNVNDALMKHLFDNRYGTGQSTFDGVFTATNRTIAGSIFVVGGYGWCGRGIAMRAKGMGANVIVTEIDPVKAIEARLDGFRVMTMENAAPEADFIVTVTGVMDIIRDIHIARLKDQVVLANAGHFDNEINKGHLEEASAEIRTLREGVSEYLMPDGRRIYLLAEGRLVNLASGQGHPAEIMDMSFAIQATCTEYLAKYHKDLEKKVYMVPDEIDKKVAWIKLKTMGVTIDKLTPEQDKYRNSWSVGT
jgi:adenosylhomocysteinase